MGSRSTRFGGSSARSIEYRGFASSLGGSREHEWEHECDWLEQGRATTLDDVYMQAVGTGGAERQSQGRCARSLLKIGLAENEGDVVVVMRRELQAPDAFRSKTRRQPRDDGADVAALERLLERLQAVARLAGGLRRHDQQLVEVHAEAGQHVRLELERRVEEHDDSAGLRRRKRRREQAHLTDARAG